MTITTELTERLRQAAGYIKKDGWTSGTEQDSAGRVCLTGAVRLCSPQPGDAWIIRQVLRKINHAEQWNDTTGRTGDEVAAYLAAFEVTDVLLAETFGPDWLKVVTAARASGKADWDALTGADLARANLTDANLAGANLTRADLAGANLTGANLTRAYLTGADLTGAYLAGANLSGAYLTGAYLAGADLTDAYLTRAYLSGANLTRANNFDATRWEVTPSGIVVAKS